VRANEKPDDFAIALEDTNCPIGTGYSHGPEGQRGVKSLELQAWMRRIGLKASIRRPCPLLDVARKLGEIAAE
jgi:hypothetical protein